MQVNYIIRRFHKNSKFKIINYSPFIKQYYEKTKNFMD